MGLPSSRHKRSPRRYHTDTVLTVSPVAIVIKPHSLVVKVLFDVELHHQRISRQAQVSHWLQAAAIGVLQEVTTLRAESDPLAH